MKMTNLQKAAQLAGKQAHEVRAQVKLAERKATSAKEKVRAAKSALKSTKKTLKAARKSAKTARKELRALTEASLEAELAAAKAQKKAAKAARALKARRQARTAAKRFPSLTVQTKPKAQAKSVHASRRGALAAKPAALPAPQPLSKTGLARRSPAVPETQRPASAAPTGSPATPPFKPARPATSMAPVLPDPAA